jgi:membrane protease YdiL (CAAX protease family)
MNQTHTHQTEGRVCDDEQTFVLRHPLLGFTVPAIAATWAVQLGFLAAGLPLFPALVIELVILVTTASTVTRHLTGRPGFRQLFAGALRWRFGLGWYAVVLLAMPFLTLTVAAVTGTLDVSANELVGATVTYLFLAVVYGAILGNVWEELAWTGFLQSRLMDRHGLFTGSMITAIPFALIHLPLIFEAQGLRGTSIANFLLGVLVLAGAAPFLRFLVGLVYLRTRRSVLAVALLHGSFNACASSTLISGGWQYVAAIALAATLAAVAVRYRQGQVARPQR